LKGKQAAIKATGNSRSESQEFPPQVSVKIPENSRCETPPIDPMCKPKVITIVIYLSITN